MKNLNKYKGILFVVAFLVLQIAIHFGITQCCFPITIQNFVLLYLFLGLLLLLLIGIIELSDLIFKEQLGFIFMALIFVKLIAAYLFIQGTEFSHNPEKFHFIIAYLVIIFVLVGYTAQKLLNTDKKH